MIEYNGYSSWRESQLTLEEWRHQDLANAAKILERANRASQGLKFEKNGKVPVYPQDAHEAQILKAIRYLNLGSHVGRCGA